MSQQHSALAQREHTPSSCFVARLQISS